MITKMVLLALALAVGPLAAQNSPGPSPVPDKAVTETVITREQAAKIIQELQMIRMLLQRDQDARIQGTSSKPGHEVEMTPRKTLTNLGQHIIGNERAPITLVEFVDLQCAFCSQFHQEVLPELRRKYIDAGKLRFVVLDFPVPSHEYAVPAAALARCAGIQGKYWHVYDAFLTVPQVATPDVIQKIATELQLNSAQLGECLASPETTDQINHEAGLGRDLGVYGTPTFLLGRSLPTGVEGRIVEGAPSLSVLEGRIHELLEQETPE